MSTQKLKFSHFLEMIDYKKLYDELKVINIILKNENSDEAKLILTIDSTRRLIKYIENQYDKDEISNVEKIKMLEGVIVIHQDLTRITHDKSITLSDEFYEKSGEVLERLTIFYPAFIFNSKLLSLEEGDDNR